MAMEPRDLDEISESVRGYMRQELPGTDAMIWPNTLSVLGKVFAMAIHLVEHRVAWVHRQIFTSTASAAHLERHAYEYGLARRAAASAAGDVETTGTPDAVYPAGIAYQSAGLEYQTAGEAKADSEGALVLRLRSVDAGVDTNRDAGEVLALIDAAAYPTLGAEATVAAGGIGGGADREGDEALRARVLDRKRRPPQGGAESDYEQWALAVPGVRKAWAQRFAYGAGTVGVHVLFNGRVNGIPTAADLEVVQLALDLRRMIRVDAQVVAPVAVAIDVEISGLATDTADTRAAILAALRAMFDERARPGTQPRPFTLSRSWIGEAVSRATGETRHVLVKPESDRTFSSGEIPVLGTVAYV